MKDDVSRLNWLRIHCSGHFLSASYFNCLDIIYDVSSIFSFLGGITLRYFVKVVDIPRCMRLSPLAGSGSRSQAVVTPPLIQ